MIRDNFKFHFANDPNLVLEFDRTSFFYSSDRHCVDIWLYDIAENEKFLDGFISNNKVNVVVDWLSEGLLMVEQQPPFSELVSWLRVRHETYFEKVLLGIKRFSALSNDIDDVPLVEFLPDMLKSDVTSNKPCFSARHFITYYSDFCLSRGGDGAKFKAIKFAQMLMHESPGVFFTDLESSTLRHIFENKHDGISKVLDPKNVKTILAFRKMLQLGINLDLICDYSATRSFNDLYPQITAYAKEFESKYIDNFNSSTFLLDSTCGENANYINGLINLGNASLVNMECVFTTDSVYANTVLTNLIERIQVMPDNELLNLLDSVSRVPASPFAGLVSKQASARVGRLIDTGDVSDSEPVNLY